MVARLGKWNRPRTVFAILVSAVAMIGALAAASRLDVARFRSDPERMRSLERSPSLCIGQTSRVSQDWPQWRGPYRDGLSPETGLLRDWPKSGPPVRWQRPIGRGFSAPVVVRGRLYTMVQDDAPDQASTPSQSREGIICLDADTGLERWQFYYPGQYEERMGSGPRSTPVVDEGFVYAVGPTGVFHCLRAETGEKVWRHDLLEEFQAKRPRYGVSFSPLVAGDLVYALPGGPTDGCVAAFDKRSGSLVWHALRDEPGYSSPVCATLVDVRQLLVFTNEALVGLSPTDGRLNWRYPWQTRDGFNIATPLTFGNYIFISSAYGKGCALLEVTRNADGSVGVREVYEHNRMRNYFASSVRYGEHIYGFDNSDLACMEIRSGAVLWRERDFRKGSLLIADGRLIILAEQGRLALAEAAPDGYRERAAFQLSKNKCWTAPVIAAGKLYVRDENHLYCLDLRKDSRSALAATDSEVP
jgi:outer membrane protein assembly factor BamB